MSEPAQPLPMPDWVRAAIVAQGKVDPDEVERAAQAIDLDALNEAEERAERARLEQLRLRVVGEQPTPAEREKWYDDL